MEDLQTIPRPQEKYVTISTSVPISLKVKLMNRALKLDTSLSDLLFHTIVGNNKDENGFNEELANIKKENESLKAKIDDLEDEIFDLSDVRENLDLTEATKENLILYIEQLQKALCKTKSLLFETFAEKEVYKFSDNETVFYVQKELKPAIENQVSQGLERIVSFVLAGKNLNRLPPQELKNQLEKTFDFQPDFSTIRPIDIDFEKWYYESYKEAILEGFKPLNDKINSFTDDFDFEDLENVCSLDVSTDFEHILNVQAQNLGYLIIPEKKQEPEPIKEPVPLATNKQESTKIQSKMEFFKSREEKILADLISEGTEFITKEELRALGFDTGFFGKLTSRGGIYGAYKLEKAPSEKVFKIYKTNP